MRARALGMLDVRGGCFGRSRRNVLVEGNRSCLDQSRWEGPSPRSSLRHASGHLSRKPSSSPPIRQPGTSPPYRELSIVEHWIGRMLIIPSSFVNQPWRTRTRPSFPSRQLPKTLLSTPKHLSRPSLPPIARFTPPSSLFTMVTVVRLILPSTSSLGLLAKPGP
jgi:hypothetical protein